MSWLDFVVKGQGHNETRYGQKSTLGILKVMGSSFRVMDNLSGEGIQAIGFLSTIIQLAVC